VQRGRGRRECRVDGLGRHGPVEPQERVDDRGVAGDRVARVEAGDRDLLADVGQLAEPPPGVGVPGGGGLVVERHPARRAQERGLRGVGGSLLVGQLRHDVGRAAREQHAGRPALGLHRPHQPAQLLVDHDQAVHPPVGAGLVDLVGDLHGAEHDREDDRHERDGRELGGEVPVPPVREHAHQRRPPGDGLVGTCRRHYPVIG
jgi:hypothetical protein